MPWDQKQAGVSNFTGGSPGPIKRIHPLPPRGISPPAKQKIHKTNGEQFGGVGTFSTLAETFLSIECFVCELSSNVFGKTGFAKHVICLHDCLYRSLMALNAVSEDDQQG